MRHARHRHTSFAIDLGNSLSVMPSPFVATLRFTIVRLTMDFVYEPSNVCKARIHRYTARARFHFVAQRSFPFPFEECATWNFRENWNHLYRRTGFYTKNTLTRVYSHLFFFYWSSTVIVNQRNVKLFRWLSKMILIKTETFVRSKWPAHLLE